METHERLVGRRFEKRGRAAIDSIAHSLKVKNWRKKDIPLFHNQSQNVISPENRVAMIFVAAVLVFAQATITLAAPKAKPPATKATTEKPGEKSDKPAAKAAPEPPIENVINVTTSELVDKPREFLNKNVKFTAKFYAFSNLPLDYKPAMRPAKTHLGFLVLRPDGHVPFSELKIAMAIPKEKEPMNQLLGSLKLDDQIEVIAKQYSSQLDEPWLDVLRLKKLASAADDKDKKDDKTASADKAGSMDKAGEKPPAPVIRQQHSPNDVNKEPIKAPPDVEQPKK
jgi:hypothetical protein